MRPSPSARSRSPRRPVRAAPPPQRHVGRERLRRGDGKGADEVEACAARCAIELRCPCRRAAGRRRRPAPRRAPRASGRAHAPDRRVDGRAGRANSAANPSPENPSENPSSAHARTGRSRSGAGTRVAKRTAGATLRIAAIIDIAPALAPPRARVLRRARGRCRSLKQAQTTPILPGKQTSSNKGAGTVHPMPASGPAQAHASPGLPPMVQQPRGSHPHAGHTAAAAAIHISAAALSPCTRHRCSIQRWPFAPTSIRQLVSTSDFSPHSTWQRCNWPGSAPTIIRQMC